MPRRPVPLREGATLPREFDLRFRGLDLVPRRGRMRDRFRIAHHCTTVQQYNARLAFLTSLHANAQDDVLRGLNDGLFTLPELEQAYGRGPRDVALLLSRRRTAEDEAKAKALEERRNPLLAPLVADYLAHWRGQDRYRVTEALQRLLAHLGPSARVRSLTAPAIRGFLGALVVQREDWKHPIGTPLAASTVNRYRTVVQGFCSRLKADGVLAAHPFDDGAIPKAEVGDSIPQPMSPAEVRDYLAHILKSNYPDDAMPLLLLMHTGVDIGELYTLKALDVVDAGTMLWLRTTRPKTSSRTRAASRKIPVTIPALCDWLRAWLTAYGLSGEDLLFTGRVSRWRLEQSHKAAVLAIKRPSITVKGLRHVAAIYWRKAGADLQTIQKWLGHASITSTVIYTEFGEDADWETPLATKAGRLQSSLIPDLFPALPATTPTTEGES